MAGVGAPPPGPLPLTGVVLCVTGLFSSAEREVVRSAVESRGGLYMADLNPRQCTHLIAAARKGDKYKAARHWGLHCVIPSWLTSCCARGARLPEEGYTVPEEEIGDKALRSQIAEMASATQLQTITQTDTGTDKSIGPTTGSDRRKMRGNEYLSGTQIYFTGLDSKSQLKSQLIQALRKGGGTRRAEMSTDVTHVIIGDGKLQASESATLRAALAEAGGPELVRPGWLLRCDVYQRLLPIEKTEAVPVSVLGNTFGGKAGADGLTRVPSRELDMFGKPEDTAGGGIARQGSGVGTLMRHSSAEMDLTNTGRVFSSLCFGIAMRNEDEKTEVRALISEGGGSVQSGIALRREDYVVVQHANVGSLKRTGAIVTPLWLRRSLRANKLLDADENILYRPFTHNFPLKAMEAFVVCVSGYYDNDKEDVNRLCDIIGITFTDRLQKKVTTHLVCPVALGDKFEKAQKWKMKLVTIEWLKTVASKGVHVPELDFPVPASNNSQMAPRPSETLKVETSTIVLESQRGKDGKKGSLLPKETEVRSMQPSSDVIMPSLPPRQPKGEERRGMKRKEAPASENIEQMRLLEDLNRVLASKPKEDYVENKNDAMLRRAPNKRISRSRNSSVETTRKTASVAGVKDRLKRGASSRGPLMRQMQTTTSKRKADVDLGAFTDSMMEPPSQRVVWEADDDKVDENREKVKMSSGRTKKQGGARSKTDAAKRMLIEAADI